MYAPRSLLTALLCLALTGCLPALHLDGPPDPPPWMDTDALVPGNRVTVLPTGPETYDAMRRAIDRARRHIHVETYILCDDRVGRDFASRLIARSRAGVDVRLIYDHQGSHLCTSPEFWQRLAQGGVEVLAFRPPQPDDLFYPLYFNRRDHRKLLIVDGRVAFTGGINLNDVYDASRFLSKARDKVWRDTNVRVEGPAVAAFQRLFLDRWRAHRALPFFAEGDFFPPLPAQGDAAVGAVASRGGDDRHPLYRTHLAAIRHARERIWLTHVYFTPEPNLVAALQDAARRGVDVRLMLPAVSDWPLIRRIGHSAYVPLLEAGVRIYERNNAYVHAKTAVVDGRWSTIGSTNLDYRSFVHNDEVNAVMVGRDVARRMEALFRRDMAHAKEITLNAWRQRPWTDRFKEQWGRLFAYWL